MRWLQPELPLAHPLDGREAAVLHRSVSETAEQFGAGARRYRRLLGPLVDRWEAIVESVLQPVVSAPRHPMALGHFGIRALPSATLVGRYLGDESASALFAGCAAHAFLPLTRPLTASFGTMLLLSGHTVGWPVAAGGSQAMADAMAALPSLARRRDPHRDERHHTSPISRPIEWCCSTPIRISSPRSRRANCRAGTGAG